MSYQSLPHVPSSPPDPGPSLGPPTCRATIIALGFPARLLTGVTLGLSLLAGPALGDYITPGDGTSYTLDDLVLVSGGAVTGSAPDYELHDSLVISTSDVLTIGPGTNVTVQDGTGVLRIEINGSFFGNGAAGDSLRFHSPTGNPGDWDGFDFRDTTTESVFHLRYGVIEDATIAVDIVFADAVLEHCALRAASEKAFDLTGSNSTLRSSVLEDNEQQTIYMTLSSSPVIEDNLIRRNNLENSSPYPYINIGLQGVNSPTIRGNTILGGDSFRSGGISIWNECHGVIEYNRIEGCGYGILCYQFDADPWIHDNTIVDNDTNPDTVNWGFGIACNGENAPTISGNRISGHNYGVAIINGAQPNVGDLGNGNPDDDGRNEFLGNGLGGEMYELYNNGPLDIKAENNWWGTTDPQGVEDRIVHSVDDPLLGTVDFDPILDVAAHGEEAVDSADPGGGVFGELVRRNLTSARAWPNPAREGSDLSFRLEDADRVRIQIFGADGRAVRTLFAGHLPAGTHRVPWDGRDGSGEQVPDGLYFWRINAGADVATGKLGLIR